MSYARNAALRVGFLTLLAINVLDAGRAIGITVVKAARRHTWPEGAMNQTIGRLHGAGHPSLTLGFADTLLKRRQACLVAVREVGKAGSDCAGNDQHPFHGLVYRLASMVRGHAPLHLIQRINSSEKPTAQ